jgi:PadR family transcriptional regulator, regulatory protein PadR
MDVPVSAKAALLQALLDGPSYGLELIARVQERTKGKIKLGDTSTYPALRSMEREGLLKSWEGEPLPERGGRPRRYYELTAEGRRAATGDKETVAGLFGIVVTGRAR